MPTQRSSFDAVLHQLEAERHARRAVMSTSADRVARTLRSRIADGDLRPGTRLPEERLGAALGVSRNTLREALSMLVAERLLARQPHRGVVVATPDADDVSDVYAARIVLEPGCLRVGVATGRDLADLRRAVDRGHEAHAADDERALADANQAFHRAVVALAGSRRLDTAMDLLLAEMRLAFHVMAELIGGVAPFHRPYLARNERICRLAEEGRAEDAAAALAAYLQETRVSLVADLGGAADTDGAASVTPG